MSKAKQHKAKMDKLKADNAYMKKLCSTPILVRTAAWPCVPLPMKKYTAEEFYNMLTEYIDLSNPELDLELCERFYNAYVNAFDHPSPENKLLYAKLYKEVLINKTDE
jgi:hypothetical protein